MVQPQLQHGHHGSTAVPNRSGTDEQRRETVNETSERRHRWSIESDAVQSWGTFGHERFPARQWLRCVRRGRGRRRATQTPNAYRLQILAGEEVFGWLWFVGGVADAKLG